MRCSGPRPETTRRDARRGDATRCDATRYPQGFARGKTAPCLSRRTRLRRQAHILLRWGLHCFVAHLASTRMLGAIDDRNRCAHGHREQRRESKRASQHNREPKRDIRPHQHCDDLPVLPMRKHLPELPVVDGEPVVPARDRLPHDPSKNRRANQRMDDRQQWPREIDSEERTRQGPVAHVHEDAPDQPKQKRSAGQHTVLETQGPALVLAHGLAICSLSGMRRARGESGRQQQEPAHHH
mmetsp:Transcript_95125/g.266359  ORF Transcript_95125/g.266359 Transcript_95125/m.266359 type:complete len:240 (-) Transcript_95125:181-900(-)